MWKRLYEKENGRTARKWRNEKSGEVLVVRKYHNDTWDTIRGERLIENFDRMDEAIKRAREIVE